MRKIKLYIAISLDGYIARPDGDLDWLTTFPNPEASDYGYQEFYDTIDTIIMGGKTHRTIVAMAIPWPYEDKTSYIVSRQEGRSSTQQIRILNDNPIQAITQLKEQDGKAIWLVGGGELVALLLNHDLIDTMIITTIPTLLGSGIPLFPTPIKGSDWNVVHTQSYTNGVMTTEYEISKK